MLMPLNEETRLSTAARRAPWTRREESIPLPPGRHGSLPIKLQLLEKVQVCDSVMYIIGLFYCICTAIHAAVGIYSVRA